MYTGSSRQHVTAMQQPTMPVEAHSAATHAGAATPTAAATTTSSNGVPGMTSTSAAATMLTGEYGGTAIFSQPQ